MAFDAYVPECARRRSAACRVVSDADRTGWVFAWLVKGTLRRSDDCQGSLF